MSTRSFAALLAAAALLLAACAGEAEAPLPPTGSSHAPYSPIEAQYLLTLQQTIAANVQTPDRRSPRSALEGTAVVRVELMRDGTIVGTTLTQKSGSRIMDNEALDVFARMRRLPPIPPDLYPEKDKAAFEVPIGYDGYSR